MIQTIEVESGTGKIRADKWISGKMPDLSRMLIQKAFEEGLVKLNNQVISN